jgi:cysteine desulfurase
VSIYLDHAATTPLDPRVLDIMRPLLEGDFGNPSSLHAFGRAARAAVEVAREQVASALGVAPLDVLFTSGGTEADNQAVKGIAWAAREAGRGAHVVTTAIEHHAVLDSVVWLGDHAGFDVTIVPPQADGIVDPERLLGAVRDDTVLVSVMAANNEIGVTQPLAEIGAIARARGALFHVDAAQAAGKIPLDVERMQVDLLSLTAHKFYGPKGCGALYVRKRVDLSPIVSGGGQERRVRAGTLNVPGIVGLGAACAICRAELAAEAARTRRLRDRLLEGLQAGLDGVIVNGSLEHRLPNNLHVTFTGVDGESLLVAIGDVAVSSGSACGSASATPSHVLAAIGATRPDSAVVRFGIGRHTTDEEIDYAVEKFTTVVRHLRRTAPAQAG